MLYCEAKPESGVGGVWVALLADAGEPIDGETPEAVLECVKEVLFG